MGLRYKTKFVLLIVTTMLVLTACTEVAVVDSPFAPAVSTTDFGYYPTAEQVNTLVARLESEFPHLVKTSVIGTSVQGKSLYALSITDYAAGDASAKPAFFLLAQQHAREPIACLAALYWIKEMLLRYGTDPQITNMLKTTAVYVVPQVNPDGNDAFLTVDGNLRTNLCPSDLDRDGKNDEDPYEALGLGAVRKTLVWFKSGWVKGGDPFRLGWSDPNISFYRKLLGYFDYEGNPVPQVDNDNDGRVNEDSLHGVDLNRNWSTGWTYADSNRDSNGYRGPAPFSEPETQALRDFVKERPNIKIAADVHSGIELVYYPRPTAVQEPIRPQILSDAVRQFVGVPSVPLEGVVGQATPWLQSRGISSLTVEVYSGSGAVSTKRIGSTNIFVAYTTLAHLFNPPAADIEAVCAKWSPYFTFLLEQVANLN